MDFTTTEPLPPPKPVQLVKTTELPPRPGRRFRSTYTAKNASEFLDLFNVAAERRTDLVINPKTPLAISTLYIKASDALLWLVDNNDPTGKWFKLKAEIRFHKEGDKVVLRFSQHPSVVQQKLEQQTVRKHSFEEVEELLTETEVEAIPAEKAPDLSPPPVQEPQWKVKLTKFLLRTKPDEVHRVKGFTKEELPLVLEMLGGLLYEIIGESEIKVIK